MMKLTDAQRADLRHLAEQATPGLRRVIETDTEQLDGIALRCTDPHHGRLDDGSLDEHGVYSCCEGYTDRIGTPADAALYAALDRETVLALLDELETTRKERDQARCNTVWLAEQYRLLRDVSLLSQERVRYWMQHAVTRRREALQQAAALVRGWHVGKGGYTELAHQIEQLAPSDAPSARADAGAQARVAGLDEAHAIIIQYAHEVNNNEEAVRTVPKAQGYGHFAANILMRAAIKVQDATHDEGQQARVGLADALPGVVDEIIMGVQDEHLTLRDALPALQRWLRTTTPPDAPRGPVAGAAGDDDVAYLYGTGWTRNLLDKWSHPEHTPQPVGRIVAVGMQRQRDGTQEVGETTSARIRAGISIRDWAYLNQRFWAYAEHYAINCWFDQETQGYYQTDAAVEIQRERDYLVTSGWGIQDDDEWYDGQGTLLERAAAVARQRQRDGEVR